MRSRLTAALLAAAALFGARAAQASGSCSVSSTSVAFGTYDVFSASPLDSAGSLSFTCTLSMSVSITLSQGGSGSFSARTMSLNASSVAYNLYLDPGRTAIFGDGTGGTSFYSSGAAQSGTVPVYGRVPALQNVAGGSYADTIIATITF